MNRSPTAAYWAERHFAARFVAAEIRSAGTHARDGGEAAAHTTAAMFDHGFDLRPHRTTRLSRPALEWADQVVVMEPMHRDVIFSMAPELASRVVELWPFIDPASESVMDPHGGPLDGYQQSATEIGLAVRALVDQVLAERRRRRQEER